MRKEVHFCLKLIILYKIQQIYDHTHSVYLHTVTFATPCTTRFYLGMDGIKVFNACRTYIIFFSIFRIYSLAERILRSHKSRSLHTQALSKRLVIAWQPRYNIRILCCILASVYGLYVLVNQV